MQANSDENKYFVYILSRAVPKIIYPLLAALIGWLFTNVFLISKDISSLKTDMENTKQDVKNILHGQQSIYDAMLSMKNNQNKKRK